MVVPAVAGASYVPGLLAAREADGLIAALELVRSTVDVDVVLVDGTGRDHPRRAGLAVHVGHALGLPSVGVTHRPLHAAGPEPGDRVGDRSLLTLDGEHVGWWLRTRAGTRAVAVHAGWRTSPDVAVDVVLRSLDGTRTPAPLREARRAARIARAAV
jgi:deoxyribonuclease V